MSEIQLPAEFESQMKALLGEQEFELFKKAINQASQTSIRINPTKPFTNSWVKRPVPWSNHGYFLEERPSFTLDPLFHAGAYYVQEASSMFIEHILRSLEIPKGVYLDLAAAPGGKSTLLASFLGEEGLLVANEVIQSRAQILKENVIKWGMGNVVVTNNDPDHFESLEGFFDLVLVDAPCSGEGMFRKDPNAREEWSLDNVQLCSARQKRIMDKAGALVKGGGYLIYSTCTFNEKENEDMIRFLTEEFAFEPARIALDPEWKIVETSVETEEGTFYGYRFFPHKVEGEGFFITVLKRPDSASTQDPGRIKDFKHQVLKSLGAKEGQALEEELGFDGHGKYYTLNDSFFRIQSDFYRYFEKITQVLNLRYFGVELGKKQKNEWIPSHEWALSNLPKNPFPKHELNLEEALDFLRKNDQEFEHLPLGWVLMTYQNLPLGWVKNLGNRINNYYPKEWRIRM
ncbi:16S rRNA C967 or C1407 C5-methylase (RsmB/RsmF family) [Algoriphagus boseongensis]|uniref:16S rRNA C967 or C1407 C5-methylase (RsmB/RsmF family) n=1 Tax=Algoriphagus boseongensis TaxID=1442587 RepID=A0A4V3D245_9BACT|nr:tRNA/rRNA cytosine-C5-methylase [Algoriphagus boseongensis]TDQ16960.1 16S rRNA C967 or C1407 C5-methylase (RsmB/RsmF family) [Algoriphagus boseongensis]